MRTFIKSSLFLFIVLILCCFSCHKHKLLESNGLPPATQGGKNTMGFLLNGKPWLPAGYDGGTANLTFDYEPNFKNGGFDIAAYQRINGRNYDESFGFGISDSLNYMSIPITLPLGQKTLFGLRFSNGTNCEYFSTDSGTYDSGSLTITKLDATPNRVIISGKFNATLYKPGCDTIHITEGRFDMSLH